MTRHAGIFALVFTAGCSLVWSMDKYEGGSGAKGSGDGGGTGTSTSGGSSGASSSGASSGTTSSGANGSTSGSTSDDGGADAGDAGEKCLAEPEPNGTGVATQEIPVGLTCGAIVTEDDIDNYKVTTSGSATITVQISPGIQVIVNPQGSGGSDIFHVPGTYTRTFGAGTHSVIVQTYDAVGAYTIRR